MMERLLITAGVPCPSFSTWKHGPNFACSSSGLEFWSTDTTLLLGGCSCVFQRYVPIFPSDELIVESPIYARNYTHPSWSFSCHSDTLTTWVMDVIHVNYFYTTIVTGFYDNVCLSRLYINSVYTLVIYELLIELCRIMTDLHLSMSIWFLLIVQRKRQRNKNRTITAKDTEILTWYRSTECPNYGYTKMLVSGNLDRLRAMMWTWRTGLSF
jgi:hypothetical protein